MNNYNELIFLVELENISGKKVSGIVKAKSEVDAVLKYLAFYPGTKHLKTITVTAKFIIK